MIHRMTYRVFEIEKALVYEDILNSRDLVVSFKDYKSPNKAEGINEFLNNGFLANELQICKCQSYFEHSY